MIVARLTVAPLQNDYELIADVLSLHEVLKELSVLTEHVLNVQQIDLTLGKRFEHLFSRLLGLNIGFGLQTHTNFRLVVGDVIFRQITLYLGVLLSLI